MYLADSCSPGCQRCRTGPEFGTPRVWEDGEEAEERVDGPELRRQRHSPSRGSGIGIGGSGSRSADASGERQAAAAPRGSISLGSGGRAGREEQGGVEAGLPACASEVNKDGAVTRGRGAGHGHGERLR